jgi:hypothetical protein
MASNDTRSLKGHSSQISGGKLSAFELYPALLACIKQSYLIVGCVMLVINSVNFQSEPCNLN